MLLRQASTTVLALIAFLDNVNAFFSVYPTATNGMTSPFASSYKNVGHSFLPSQKTMTLFSSDSDEASPPPPPPSPPVMKPPRDMNYIPANIMRQLENYRNIRNVGGAETVNDIYVRDPETDIFWFAGKCARCTGTVTLEQAIARQWSYIEEHACRLRVAELSLKYGSLEIWAAPADSELDVAYNKPTIQFQKMTKRPDWCVKEVKSVEIGFENEIYEEGEEGFRARRTNDGLPVNPEIIPPQQ